MKDDLINWYEFYDFLASRGIVRSVTDNAGLIEYANRSLDLANCGVLLNEEGHCVSDDEVDKFTIAEGIIDDEKGHFIGFDNSAGFVTDDDGNVIGVTRNKTIIKDKLFLDVADACNVEAQLISGRFDQEFGLGGEG